MPRSIKLFLSYCHSYCHEDEKLKEALIGHLAVLQRQKVIETWHDRENEYFRAHALSAIVPHLPDRLMDEALKSANQIQDLYFRAIAFQGFTQQLTHISTTPKFWSETLHLFSPLKRRKSIHTLANLKFFLLILGGTDALKAMVRVLKEVCEEWR